MSLKEYIDKNIDKLNNVLGLSVKMTEEYKRAHNNPYATQNYVTIKKYVIRYAFFKKYEYIFRKDHAEDEDCDDEYSHSFYDYKGNTVSENEILFFLMGKLVLSNV